MLLVSFAIHVQIASDKPPNTANVRLWTSAMLVVRVPCGNSSATNAGSAPWNTITQAVSPVTQKTYTPSVGDATIR